MAISKRARSGSQSMVSASDRPPSKKSSTLYHCAPAQRSMRSVTGLMTANRPVCSLHRWLTNQHAPCTLRPPYDRTPSNVVHGKACFFNAQIEEPPDTVLERLAKLGRIPLVLKCPIANLFRGRSDKEIWFRLKESSRRRSR